MNINESLLEKLAAYKPRPETISSVRYIPLLFVVGISGAGKDATQHRLLTTYPDDYQLMISHTTRKPRVNNGVMERNGVEYYFIDIKTAEHMLDTGQYLEVKRYAGNIYGTTTAELARVGRSNKIILNDIEVQGVGEYVRLGLNVKPVFLLPPTYEVWQERLLARYNGKPDQLDIHKRMKTALLELDYALANDFFYLVVNNDLDETVAYAHMVAHNKPVEARPPKLIKTIKNIRDEIGSRLAGIDAAPLL